jgi:hypothetical protein
MNSRTDCIMRQISDRLEVVSVMLMKICLLGQGVLVTEKYRRFEKISLRVH